MRALLVPLSLYQMGAIARLAVHHLLSHLLPSSLHDMDPGGDAVQIVKPELERLTKRMKESVSSAAPAAPRLASPLILPCSSALLVRPGLCSGRGGEVPEGGGCAAEEVRQAAGGGARGSALSSGCVLPVQTPNQSLHALGGGPHPRAAVCILFFRGTFPILRGGRE